MSVTSSAGLISRSHPSGQTLKWLVMLQVALLAGVVVTEITQFAYLDHDTFIYTLVGEGIYKHGLMPYDYVFDHKPFLLYFVYGLTSFLDGGWNSYALLTFVAVIGLAAIVKGLYTGGRWPFVVLVLAMAAATIENVAYSGNSEILIVPLQLLAVGLLLTSAGRPARFFGSALVSVVAVNANYTAGIPLLLALLYCLWVRSGGTVKAFLAATIGYGLVCLALIAALFAVAAAAGMDVVGYLQMQATFLGGYSGYDAASFSESVNFAVRIAPFLVIALLPLVPGLRPAKADRPAVIALELLIVGSLIVFALSGQYYPHYIFLAAGPAVVVFLLLRAESRIYRFARAGALTLVSLYYVLDIGSGWTNSYTDGIKSAYAPLADVVADQDLLSMRASVVPLYFSDARPFWPFVWHDHIAVVYGIQNEDAVYADVLGNSPPFVMTQSNWCETRGSDWQACARLRDGYDRIMTRDYTSGVPGYTLWQRSGDEASQGDIVTD